MPNMPKQPGDAVLSRDGTVKVNGRTVGVYWVDCNRLYHFDFKRPESEELGWGVVTSVFRHTFKAAIPAYLARINNPPRRERRRR